MKFKLFCWTKALAMNPRVSFSILVFIFWFGLGLGQAEQLPATNNEVWVLRFSGPIGPVSAKYITNGVEKANDAKAECLILEMDTPGGLDESMREIIQAILQSAIPVITYVYPSGARAASAGVFITLASHVAAMAPGTNIGAAHPVAMGGKEMDEEMKEKVTNDAAAYIKSIAEKRQRNMKWAEDAVRKSVSATEKEALKLRVIDLVAGSLEELIEKLDKRKVKLDGKEIILQTASAKIKKVGMTPVQRFLYLLTNPNIAYILLLLGIYGLFFELQNPGAIFPGVVGGICLILAFYSLQLLPVNYAGLALIVLAIIMFILEIKVTSYGLLTIGGIAALFFGSILLFESPVPFFRPSILLIAAAAIITAAFFALIVGLGIRAHLRKPITGKEGLVNEIGFAQTDLNPSGVVMVSGELWSAESGSGEIKKNEKVKVVEVKGMNIKVEKV
ncbi:MAG: nodulation protein NfeD [candidate division WOR-3 bacterium]|nr:nodulation protein NfeD [candidate division WOR-3 bacterium]